MDVNVGVPGVRTVTVTVAGMLGVASSHKLEAAVLIESLLLFCYTARRHFAKDSSLQQRHVQKRSECGNSEV